MHTARQLTRIDRTGRRSGAGGSDLRRGILCSSAFSRGEWRPLRRAPARPGRSSTIRHPTTPGSRNRRAPARGGGSARPGPGGCGANRSRTPRDGAACALSRARRGLSAIQEGSAAARMEASHDAIDRHSGTARRVMISCFGNPRRPRRPRRRRFRCQILYKVTQWPTNGLVPRCGILSARSALRRGSGARRGRPLAPRLPCGRAWSPNIVLSPPRGGSGPRRSPPRGGLDGDRYGGTPSIR
jgi:hypothetical protein